MCRMLESLRPPPPLGSWPSNGSQCSLTTPFWPSRTHEAGQGNEKNHTLGRGEHSSLGHSASPTLHATHPVLPSSSLSFILYPRLIGRGFSRTPRPNAYASRAVYAPTEAPRVLPSFCRGRRSFPSCPIAARGRTMGLGARIRLRLRVAGPCHGRRGLVCSLGASTKPPRALCAHGLEQAAPPAAPASPEGTRGL